MTESRKRNRRTSPEKLKITIGTEL